ncbi:MAG: hypothetical protein ACHQUB_01495 [Candidatus Saccharimonadia bacterium]
MASHGRARCLISAVVRGLTIAKSPLRPEATSEDMIDAMNLFIANGLVTGNDNLYWVTDAGAELAERLGLVAVSTPAEPKSHQHSLFEWAGARLLLPAKTISYLCAPVQHEQLVLALA